jgi:hypothetical protein
LGTWRFAIYHGDKLYLATNSGELYLGEDEKSVVVCSDDMLPQELPEFKFSKVPKNTLIEISKSCEMTRTKLKREKQFVRQPS